MSTEATSIDVKRWTAKRKTALLENKVLKKLHEVLDEDGSSY